MFDSDLKFYGVSKNLLRNNSLFTALTAEIIALRVGDDPQAAYSAGLMRLIGKVVLDQLAKETGSVSGTFGTSGESDLLAWEGKVFGMTNADVSSLILQEWKFPESVALPVADQYLPLQGMEDHRRTALIVNLSAGLAVGVVAAAGQAAAAGRILLVDLQADGAARAAVLAVVRRGQARLEEQ